MNYQREAKRLVAQVERLVNQKTRLLKNLLIYKRSVAASRRRLVKVSRVLKEVDPDKVIFWGLCIPGDLMEHLMSLTDRDRERKLQERRNQLVKTIAGLLKTNKLKPLS
ncbi:MAG: hypothetical protein HZB99_01650 [Candidatus Harrisonbacteria bacterium]|nr:hypothetical protein [Candidatus Harrisonbacteria bacterium]